MSFQSLERQEDESREKLASQPHFNPWRGDSAISSHRDDKKVTKSSQHTLKANHGWQPDCLLQFKNHLDG